MLNVVLSQSNKQSNVPQPSKNQHTSVSLVLFNLIRRPINSQHNVYIPNKLRSTNLPQPYQAKLVHEVFGKKAGKENTEEKIAITMVLMTINDDNDDEGSEKDDIRSDQGICGDGE